MTISLQLHECRGGSARWTRGAGARASPGAPATRRGLARSCLARQHRRRRVADRGGERRSRVAGRDRIDVDTDARRRADHPHRGGASPLPPPRHSRRLRRLSDRCSPGLEPRAASPAAQPNARIDRDAASGPASTGFRSSSATSGWFSTRPAEPVQHVGDRRAVGRRRTAPACDEPARLAARDQLVGVDVRERREREPRRADQLGQHAARARRRRAARRPDPGSHR